MNEQDMFDRLSLPTWVLDDANSAYYYARHVMDGRFELGEELIASNKVYARWYAMYVIKEDFYYDGVLIAAY